MGGTRRKPKHQQCLRAAFLSIVQATPDRPPCTSPEKIWLEKSTFGKCRAAQFCQPRHQRLRRIPGAPAKRAKTGNEMRNLSLTATTPRSVRLQTEGVMRPSATSVSVFHLGAMEASARGRDIIRCSSIDHIHFTCCSRRRAANSPEAFMACGDRESLARALRGRCRSAPNR